jgi:hypothetical protein
MGTPIPEPPEVPNPDECVACTPAGFPTGYTPYQVTVVFHNVANYGGAPQFPNDKPFTLPQVVGLPCLYFATVFDGITNWDITLNTSTSDLSCGIHDLVGPLAFIGVADPCSPGPFANTAAHPPAYYDGGTAYITDLPLAPIVLLAQTYNLLPDARGLYDIRDSATPDHKCVRLTGRTYPGSVLIDLDLGAI